jgi:hypothetical protein
LPLSPGLVAALKIPKFIRVPKGQARPRYVPPDEVTLEGDLPAKFVNEILAATPHYSGGNAKALTDLGAVGKVFGTPNGDPKHGKLLGAAFGRFWYAQ